MLRSAARAPDQANLVRYWTYVQTPSVGDTADLYAEHRSPVIGQFHKEAYAKYRHHEYTKRSARWHFLQGIYQVLGPTNRVEFG